MPRGFEALAEHEIPSISPQTTTPPQTNVAREASAATQMLLLGLKALSQRAIVALSTLFTAGGLFSAWWLWSSVLPSPSVLQLTGIGMYAVFLLALEWVRRR